MTTFSTQRAASHYAHEQALLWQVPFRIVERDGLFYAMPQNTNLPGSIEVETVK